MTSIFQRAGSKARMAPSGSLMFTPLTLVKQDGVAGGARGMGVDEVEVGAAAGGVIYSYDREAAPPSARPRLLRKERGFGRRSGAGAGASAGADEKDGDNGSAGEADSTGGGDAGAGGRGGDDGGGNDDDGWAVMTSGEQGFPARLELSLSLPNTSVTN